MTDSTGAAANKRQAGTADITVEFTQQGGTASAASSLFAGVTLLLAALLLF